MAESGHSIGISETVWYRPQKAVIWIAGTQVATELKYFGWRTFRVAGCDLRKQSIWGTSP